MLVGTVRPFLGDIDLAKLHLHHRMRIFGFGPFAGFHVVDLGEHAIVQLRIRVGIVALLPSGYVSGIRVSRIQMLVVARIVDICGIVWLNFERYVDAVGFLCDDTVFAVKRHRHRAAFARLIDTVRGRIFARQRLIAVLHRHMLCDVGAVGCIREIDRIHPLGQGVGDREDLDLRGRGDGGIDLFECFRQIRRIRAVEFHAIHRIGLTRKIIHLIGFGSGLHHVQGGVAAPVSLSQGGSIVVIEVITASGAMYVFANVIRVHPIVSDRHAIRFGRIFRPRPPPAGIATAVIRGRTVRRIAIREEDDVLLHTRATLQIVVCLLERGLPVGAALGVTLHGAVDFRDVYGEILLDSSVRTECHHRHPYLLILRQI